MITKERFFEIGRAEGYSDALLNRLWDHPKRVESLQDAEARGLTKEQVELNLRRTFVEVGGRYGIPRPRR